MKISKSSLHYRWFEKLNSYFMHEEFNPTNLCWYFWQSLFLNTIFLVSILVSPILLLIAAIVGIGYLIYLVGKFIINGTGFSNSLLGKYLKAKKDKVCPLIELVD